MAQREAEKWQVEERPERETWKSAWCKDRH